jgi:hypothetical protein
MVSSNIVRTGGGLASVAAGALLLLGHLASLGGDPAYGTVLGSGLVLVAHTLLVFALTAICAAQAERGGITNALGMVLGVAGTTLNVAAIFVELAGAGGRDVDAVLTTGLTGGITLGGGLAFLVGLILVGVAAMRSGVFPRWAGATLIAGDLVFGAGSFAGSAAMAVAVAGALLTCAAFVWLGSALLRRDGRETTSVLLPQLG